MPTYLFDAYGTLLDLSAAFRIAEPRLGTRLTPMLERWRATQLDYAWLSALGDRFRSFDMITRDAFRDSLAADGIVDDALVDDLCGAFATLPAYPDAAATLQALKARGDTCAILSNGTPQWLRASIDGAEIGTSLDAILSTQVVRTYKPAPTAYALATATFKQPAAAMIFVSSNWWDVVGARDFGYQTIWIDRGNAPWPASVAKPQTVASCLAEVVTIGVNAEALRY